MNTFGRDFSNLNNLFQPYESPVHIQGLLQRKGTISDAARVLLALHFKKTYYLGFLLNLVPKESFSGNFRHIFSKVNKAIV